jgi:hypothetical protein
LRIAERAWVLDTNSTLEYALFLIALGIVAVLYASVGQITASVSFLNAIFRSWRLTGLVNDSLDLSR